MSKHFEYINSANRIAGTSSHFTTRIDVPPGNWDLVTCLRASIPKSYYLIEEGSNTFTLNEPNGLIGALFTITLTPGNYTRKTLGAELMKQLDGTGRWTYKVIWSVGNADDGKFTYQVSDIGANDPPQFIFTADSPYEAMGFEPGTWTFNASTLDLVSPNVMRLDKETTLFIHSDICASSSASSVGSSNASILQEVYAVGSPYYSQIVFDNPLPLFTAKRFVGRSGNSYTFFIADENGREINLNGQNIVLTLVFMESDGTDRTKTLLNSFLEANLIERI